MQVKLDFKHRLAELKQEIDAGLTRHIQTLKKTTVQNFTPYSAVAVDAYAQILDRGGKRIRGALTVIGYEMSGGKDHDMIIEAAVAIELVHAYILVLDDIMDKSVMRRGGASAHTAVTTYHKVHGLAGDSSHFGEAVAINAALIGGHYAQTLVSGLAVADSYKIEALRLLNEALIVTGHGQINDLFNEVTDEAGPRAVDQVLEWKTAHYTFLNPLQFGMALAGATKTTLAAIHEYCMHAGRAFQITDDILGTFGSELEAGKSPMDDIREGKRTVLSVTALQNAQNGNKNFLITMLGNERLTQAEFSRCKEIFIATGALEEAQKQAVSHVAQAKLSLDQNKHYWNESGADFLTSLVESLLGRNS